MVIKLLLFMLSFFGVMVVGPAILLAAIFLFGVNLESLVVKHPADARVVFAAYGIFVTYMFFKLQDVFIVFKPEKGIAPESQTSIIHKLETVFNSPSEDKRLFDFAQKDKKVAITWKASINYLQPTSVGGVGKKRVITLTLDESNHTAFFVMKDKDWNWSLSKNFASASLYYSVGIFAEFETNIYPSISIGDDGHLKIDLKKLTYSSNDLWLPIQSCFLSLGWALRGGMLPKLWQRIAFSLPMGIVFYLFACFITWVMAQPK